MKTKLSIPKEEKRIFGAPLRVDIFSESFYVSMQEFLETYHSSYLGYLRQMAFQYDESPPSSDEVTCV